MSGSCVKGIIASLVVFSLPACSTVIRAPGASEDLATTEERAALKEAAAGLAWSPWPKPQDAFLTANLPGEEDETRMTRARAVEIYLASLGDRDAAAQIAADARRHLVAADALADAARLASQSDGPRLSDVAVLEASIADLREARAVYIAALKKIDSDGDTIDEVRDPLDVAVKKLGRIADDLAENAMKKRSSNFAGPGARTARAGAL